MNSLDQYNERMIANEAKATARPWEHEAYDSLKAENAQLRTLLEAVYDLIVIYQNRGSKSDRDNLTKIAHKIANELNLSRAALKGGGE